MATAYRMSAEIADWLNGHAASHGIEAVELDRHPSHRHRRHRVGRRRAARSDGSASAGRTWPASTHRDVWSHKGVEYDAVARRPDRDAAERGVPRGVPRRPRAGGRRPAGRVSRVGRRPAAEHALGRSARMSRWRGRLRTLGLRPSARSRPGGSRVDLVVRRGRHPRRRARDPRALHRRLAGPDVVPGRRLRTTTLRRTGWPTATASVNRSTGPSSRCRASTRSATTIYPGTDHPPGFGVLLSVTSFLGIRGTLAHQIWCAVMGTVTVLLIGLVGRRLAGNRAGLVGRRHRHGVPRTLVDRRVPRRRDARDDVLRTGGRPHVPPDRPGDAVAHGGARA